MFFKCLENPYYPSVGPHLKLLGFIGFWHPRSTKTNTTRFKKILFYVTVSFFISQYIKCLIKFDIYWLKLILQYAPFHIGIVKACYFQKYINEWRNLLNFLSAVERSQIRRKSTTIRQIIEEYIRKNRRVTYFFWGMGVIANLFIFSEPLLKQNLEENVFPILFDGYTPFSGNPPGYYVALLIQTVLGNFVSVFVVAWDTLVVSTMIFFAGQMKMARSICTRILKKSGSPEVLKDIAGFHLFYTDLLKYQQLFNSLISPVMFVYLIVISVNLGVCIIQIVTMKDNVAMMVYSLVFMVACLIQLLIFYWHSNEVTLQSQQISYGLFESAWPEADVKLKKMILLLGFTTRKILVFRAGPLTKMNLSTFVGILRASYSFYTMLSGKD